MHSPVEIVSVSDIEVASKLIAAFARSLSPECRSSAHALSPDRCCCCCSTSTGRCRPLGRAADAHRDALHAALLAVHGLDAEEIRHPIAPAGRTDGEIARALLLAAGVTARRIDERALEVKEESRLPQNLYKLSRLTLNSRLE